MAGIFRKNDIRINGAELTPENIDLICESTIVYLQEKGIKELLIGNDMRVTSELFKHALTSRALSGGIDVTLIQDSLHRVCSTPLFNYICSICPQKAGIIITASHNPVDYNGLKINFPQCRAIGYEEGLKYIETFFKNRSKQNIGNSKGSLSEIYPIQDFIKETCEQIGFKKGEFKEVRIAFDCANSTSVIDAKEFFSYLDADVHYINDWLDGTFPVHESDPLIPKNLKGLISLVCSDKRFICGATGDGDYDRIGIVDETGKILDAHHIASIVTHELMKNIQKPEEVSAIYATTMGRAFKDAVERYGGKTHMVPVGRSVLITKGTELMKETKVLIGAENSNHIMFPDKHGNFYENILLATGCVISYCLKNKLKLSEAVKQTDKYNRLKEINFKISSDNTDRLLEDIKKNFNIIPEGELNLDDGVLVEDSKAGEWFSLRVSDTEPVLRLNVETLSEQRTKLIAEALIQKINFFGGLKIN